MKVRFNGLVEKHTEGCNCHGKKTSYGLTTRRFLVMPSGASRMFYRDKVEEVSDSDGEWLLSFNSDRHEAFTRVE